MIFFSAIFFLFKCSEARSLFYIPTQAFKTAKQLSFNPIHCQRFPDLFTARGVGDQHPLE